MAASLNTAPGISFRTACILIDSMIGFNISIGKRSCTPVVWKGHPASSCSTLNMIEPHSAAPAQHSYFLLQEEEVAAVFHTTIIINSTELQYYLQGQCSVSVSVPISNTV
eukprot:scaffold1224_cov288-Chaetoceros_neogracile.AAC.16